MISIIFFSAPLTQNVVHNMKRHAMRKWFLNPSNVYLTQPIESTESKKAMRIHPFFSQQRNPITWVQELPSVIIARTDTSDFRSSRIAAFDLVGITCSVERCVWLSILLGWDLDQNEKWPCPLKR